MVYRIVLAEQLLGTVLTWGHGPMAIATTISTEARAMSNDDRAGLTFW